MTTTLDPEVVNALQLALDALKASAVPTETLKEQRNIVQKRVAAKRAIRLVLQKYNI